VVAGNTVVLGSLGVVKKGSIRSPLRCLGGVARGRVIIRGIGVVAWGSVSYGIIIRWLSGVVLGGLGVVTGR
jgi:hypothetical protein